MLEDTGRTKVQVQIQQKIHPLAVCNQETGWNLILLLKQAMISLQSQDCKQRSHPLINCGSNTDITKVENGQT